MAERLRKGLLYSYGIGDLFFALMVNMEAYFFTAFLTDYAQFSLTATGQILGLTGVVDIVCAIAGGIILQKATLRYGGKYRSWFLIGPPLVAPLFILQFTRIGSDLTALLIVVFGFVTSHLLFNVVVSATGAMAGRLSQLPDERTILSTSRAQGMSVASLVFSMTAMPMILFFGARTGKVAGFTVTVAIYAFFMILGYWYIYRITAGKDPYDEAPAGSVGHPGHSVVEIIGLVFKNGPLMALMLAGIFSSSSLFIYSALALYYFTYVVGQPELLTVFLTAISVSRLAGTFAAAWIGVRLGKRNSYWIFLALAAAGFASGRLLVQTPWGFTAVFCVAVLLGAVASSMNTALFADTVVYGEWKTGRNIRAFTMALMNLPIKLGVLIRSVVVTVGLMAIGFVANTAPSKRVVDGIASIVTLSPAAACAIAAAVFFVGYRIDEKSVVRMQEEIAARKATVGTR